MRRVIFAIVATAAALVVLLSFKTHTSPAIASSSAAGGSPGPVTGKQGTSAGSPAASRGASAGSAARTVTGDEAQTMYGPVQVKITVSGGKVTAADAIEYPLNDPRDQQINSYAIPALNSEAVGASSANIDSVSGATYTSEGYVTSLQSALNKAGL